MGDVAWLENWDCNSCTHNCLLNFVGRLCIKVNNKTKTLSQKFYENLINIAIFRVGAISYASDDWEERKFPFLEVIWQDNAAKTTKEEMWNNAGNQGLLKTRNDTGQFHLMIFYLYIDWNTNASKHIFCLNSYIMQRLSKFDISEVTWYLTSIYFVKDVKLLFLPHQLMSLANAYVVTDKHPLKRRKKLFGF